MKSVKPTIEQLLPQSIIEITTDPQKMLGISDAYQLDVKLNLAGDIPASVIASLEIHNASLYRFENSTGVNHYRINMSQSEQNTMLRFRIRNLSFVDGGQPDLLLGVFTWDEDTGSGISLSDHVQLQIKINIGSPINFKTLQ